MKTKTKKPKGLMMWSAPAGRTDPAGRGERGMVLVLVLILAFIATGFTAGMLLMVTSGTGASGGHKRYETALEAGRAGAEIAREMVDARDDPEVSGGLNGWQLPAEAIATALPGGDCLRTKLLNDYDVWNGVCNGSVAIDPAVSATYDMAFTLGGDPSCAADPANCYSVYAKIVDTVDGNSGGFSELEGELGTVESHSGEITTMSLPFLYTIEVLAQNVLNPLERARLSFLYQF